MKLNTSEFKDILTTWTPISAFTIISPNGNDPRSAPFSVRYRDFFKVYRPNSNEVTMINDYYYWYKDPNSNKIAFRIQKNYWSVGRKMRIESQLIDVASGEYRIVSKAKSNSYDEEDFLVVEPAIPTLDSPRKALNWLERQVAALEAQDGVTTEKLVEEMRVRG